MMKIKMYKANRVLQRNNNISVRDGDGREYRERGSSLACAGRCQLSTAARSPDWELF